MAKSKKPEAPAVVTQAQLKRKVLETMEDDQRITPKQMTDVVDSLQAVIGEAMGEGRKVSLWGIVTLTPRFRMAKPKRKGRDPRTGEETTFNAQPAKVQVRATVAKAFKDALPKANSGAGSSLKAVAEHAAKEAAKREKARAKA